MESPAQPTALDRATGIQALELIASGQFAYNEQKHQLEGWNGHTVPLTTLYDAVDLYNGDSSLRVPSFYAWLAGRDLADALALLKNGSQDYIVARERMLQKLPLEVAGGFEEIARFKTARGWKILLRERLPLQSLK